MRTLVYRRLVIVLWGILWATLLLTESVHSFTKTLTKTLTSKTSASSTSSTSSSRRCMGQALFELQHNSTQERSFRGLQQVLWNTTCSKCTTTTLSSSSSLDDAQNRTLFHATMVVTGPSNDELISLVAGLLTENVQVTLLLIVDDNFNNISSNTSRSDNIRSNTSRSAMNDTIITTQILNRVPCEQESTAKRLLSTRLLAVHEELPVQCQHQPSSLQSACGLEMVNSTLHLLKQQQQQQRQDSNNATNVWILQATSLDDPTLVGALLYAEQLQLPTIALTDSKAILELVLQHDPEWTACGNIISRMLALLHQRWHSLGLTRTVMRWNHIRRRLSFPVLHPMDFFPTVVTLIVPWAQEDTTATTTELPEDTISSPIPTSPNRVLFGSIYPPPCSPCLEKEDTVPPTSPPSLATVQDDNATVSTMVILVQPPGLVDDDWTPASIRELVRGLALVKTSLESYDDCEWDSLTCLKPQHVRVVWLGGGKDAHAQFPILPSFVHPEPVNTNILDSIARQPKEVSTTMVLSSCQQGDTQVLHNWGVRVMCWSSIPSPSSSSYQARDLAIRLLELLRQPVAVWNTTDTTTSSSSSSSPSSSSLGLPQVVSLVRRIAETQQQQQKTPWTNIEQMQRQINQALWEHHGLPSESSSLEEDELLTHPPYDTFTVLIAWLVILASIGYIGLKDTSSSSNLRWKTRRHTSAASSMAHDGILKRLPDLDEAWTALVDWYKDQPLILRESSLTTTSTSSMPTRRNRTMSETSHGGLSNSHNHHHHNHHHSGNIRRRRKR
jgi:hypothetical protein